MAGARGRRGGGALLPLAVLAGLAAGAAAGSGAGDQGTTTLGAGLAPGPSPTPRALELWGPLASWTPPGLPASCG